MKKVLIIGLIVAGFTFASASRSDAGVSVGIGFGGPFGYGGYYPHSYGCYPYGYGYYPYARPYYRTVVYSSPRRWYWRHGRRVYYSRPYYYRRY